MPRAIGWAAAIAAALSGCGGSPPAPSGARQLPTALAPDASVFRLPHNGGTAELLNAQTLASLDWEIDDVPAIARGLGTDLEAQTSFAIDRRGRLIGLDLYAHRAVSYLGADEFSATPDGVILGLDSARRPIRFANRAPTIFRAKVAKGPVVLYKGPGTQILAFAPGAEVAQVVGEDGEARRFTIPNGQLAVTWYGDLAAVTTDSGEVVFEPRSSARPKFVHLRGTPVTAAFSPSGHRLYVARAEGDLVMLNRFDAFASMGTLSLPAPATMLRVDRSGRWLVAHGKQGDSVWVVDLARWQLAATVASSWADDLPVVSDARTLLVRDDRDVVALDLTTAQPIERARLRGAAADVFLVVPMLPSSRLPKPAPKLQASAGTDSTPARISPTATDAAAPPAAAAAVYVQVSSSQNVDWARALVEQLKDGGFPATVLAPASGAPEAGYRVVVGPYPSRDSADSVGRRLNRPYFLITPGSPDH